jgi:hypothetical protein
MHQVLATIDALDAALKSAVHANPVFLPTDEKRDALVALVRLENRLAELRLRGRSIGC